MKAWHWGVAGIVVLVLIVVGVGRLLGGDEGAGTPAPGATARPLASTQLPALAPGGAGAPAPVATHDVPLPPQPVSTVDAAESMKQAQEHGDPSAPPVVRDVARERPTAAELADPKAYQQYEARQNQRLYNQYVQAADNEIPRLQADIQRARAAGLSPQQIAEGEEKLRRIQAMRDQLQAEKGAVPTAPATPAAP